MRVHATVHSDGKSLVTLPTGEVAEIQPHTFERGAWCWSIAGAEQSRDTSGTCYSQEHAYRCASEASARRTMHPRQVAGFSLADARELEDADQTVYTKRLKSLLIQSTGHRGFSIRSNRGTACCWINVRGIDETGRLWVAAIFGSDATIPPTRGYRAWCAARAAGLPDASEIKRSEHAWEGN